MNAPSARNAPQSKGRNALPVPNVLNAHRVPNAHRALNVRQPNGLPHRQTALKSPSKPANLASNSRVRRNLPVRKRLQMSLPKPLPRLKELQYLKPEMVKPAAVAVAVADDASVARNRIKLLQRPARLPPKPIAQKHQQVLKR